MRVFFALLIACALVAGSGGSFSALAQTAANKGTSASPVPTLIELVTPKPDAKPAEMLKFRRPVLFVVVLGSNADLKARISTAMARVLGDDLSLNVVPEGDWAIKDYMQQCTSDPSTAGAFIVQPPGYGTSEQDRLITLRQVATVQFNAMISTCPQFYKEHEIVPRPTPGPPEITWVAQTSTGEYGRTYVQFLPFAVLTSVYLAFAPQKLFQVLTTHTNRVPSPIPSAGYNSTVSTEYQNTINASGTSSLQNSVVTSVGAAALDFGQKADPNHLTGRAAEAAAWQFLQGYHSYCEGKSLTHAAIDEATFCSWLHPFIGGKITYDTFEQDKIPAYKVPVTLIPEALPNAIPKEYPEPQYTQSDCLGTFHFTKVESGIKYKILVDATPSPGPLQQEVTVQATGDSARQILYFSIAQPAASPCPTSSPRPDSK